MSRKRDDRLMETFDFLLPGWCDTDDSVAHRGLYRCYDANKNSFTVRTSLKNETAVKNMLKPSPKTALS